MFGSSIMNTQVTTTKHLTLEIILMNLQVSRVKISFLNIILWDLFSLTSFYLYVCVCVYQAWVNPTTTFIPVERCSWTGCTLTCRPTSSLPRKVKRWASVNWRRCTYRSTNLLWWVCRGSKRRKCFDTAAFMQLVYGCLFQWIGLQALCMLIGVTDTSVYGLSWKALA